MTFLLARRFVADHVRNGYNLLLLLVVPVVFVVVAAPALVDSARLLGGAGGGSGIEIVTAGWVAAFLTAISMYFQVSGNKEPDRRLVRAGLHRRHLIEARLLTGAVLALVAVLAALGALALRTGIDDPGRVVAGTAMFAIVYLGIGAIVGATVANTVNGTVIVMFVWILDIFFGPTLSGSSAVVLRLLPTHFVSLWTVDLPPGHGGPATLTWSLLWTAGSVLAAAGVVAASAGAAQRRHRPRRHAVPAGVRGDQAAGQFASGLRAGWRQWRRVPLFWVLLLVVPAVFVLLSDAITPHGRTVVVLREAGSRFVAQLDPADIHGGLMAPIAVGSLASLVGVFVVLDNRVADSRLALSGQRRWVLMTTRLTMVVVAALVASAVSLVVAAPVFEAGQWGVYATGLVLIGLTYGLVGVVIGPVFGRVSGVFLAFLVPFLDLGIGQSPMLRAEPSGWAQWLPGYGGIRVVIDGGLTPGFDESRALFIAVTWIVVLVAAAVLVLRLAPSDQSPGLPLRHG